jgi:FtsH-binding integral membrane protein
VIWDRALPLAVAVALVEAVVLGYVFSAFSGSGFLFEYWALMAAVVGFTTLIGAIASERIARIRLPGPIAAHLALIIGPLLGLAAGYLLQPGGGPT